uniref:P-type domain-containing protein n=1 Tax=Neolamprologus brichardi TaxID=32507 RepID=A0A3Q4HJX6_NEOBR
MTLYIILLPAASVKEEILSQCNLPHEQRLPCGSSSLSQTQCLSMGCCFNKHPPACYYPMDGELQSASLLTFSHHLAEYI